jgi:integrase
MSSRVPRLPLQDLALEPRSRKAYDRNLYSFLTFARLPLQQFLIEPATRLDRLLAVYIQYSYDSGLSFTNASHALHGVVFHRPEFKEHLFISRQCLRGWDRVKISVSRPPLTWELTVCIACALSKDGHHGPAVAALLAFDCYLRVGELTRIRFKDVVMPNDARMGRAHPEMAVCLGKTKTGRDQSVSVQNTDVADVLSFWVRSLPRSAAEPNPLIFPFSPDFFRRLLRRVCVQLGVGHIPYVPHSLRHGGATADFLRTGSVEHVQFRGRWKSLESVRTYIQTARALLAAQDVLSILNELGQKFNDSLVPVMRHLLTSVPQVLAGSRRKRVTFRLAGR